jgi:multiple sugar transport system ATP-binding protein
MRAEISALHERVQKTFVYVTHDQVEAMTMGTRIIVLDRGVVQQEGTPEDIYERPANTFVAGFIGSPPMNLLPMRPEQEGVVIGEAVLPGSASVSARARELGLTAVTVGIRPEKVAIHLGKAVTPHRIAASVSLVERLGSETVIGFRLDAYAGESEVDPVAGQALYYAKLGGNVAVEVGKPCAIDFDLADVIWFDPKSGRRVEL